MFVDVVAAAVLATFALAAPQEEKLKVGDPAPPFAMKTINADLSKMNLFTLGKHVGESPAEPRSALVLSFAASYCGPCKKELAELKKMEQKLTKGSVLLAVVVIDTEPDGIEEMKKLTVDELKLPYPVLSDRFGVLARRYHASALPYMVVIDKAGNVQWVHSGFTETALTDLAQQLKI